jgi:class 3 adenylate cyclase/tetratricopeptide (TPR) repeat protein
MPSPQQQLEAGIQALEAQRALLGDAVVDASISGLRAKLAALTAASDEPAQTLKQVSIVFLDVVGSTALSQHLDPEDVSAVMDDALERGTSVVRAHRGKVLQYAGDNILAAFGAEGAAEDDAERAVHCGLALLALGKALGAEVQARHGHTGLDVRVGIHTGGVLLGGGVDAEGTIRGSAVNIAARMEQTAPAGALRISHDTYAQVRGMFEVQAQEPLAVKGVDAPVQSYLVTCAKSRQFRIGTRGIEGVATRMIGRDAELEALQAAFKRLFRQRRLAAVTVVAEAGLGKSRLLHEFEVWSDARDESFVVFRGRATPATGSQAYGLLRDLVAWRFQIADDDSLEAARQKMEAGIVPLFVDTDGPDLAEAHAHLLGHLIGIDWKHSRHLRGILDDPKQIRNRAFHAAAQLLRRVGASQNLPVVLQLEDLHWADGESLDFLNYLAEVNRDAALLVLAFTRPTLFERRTDWGSAEGIHQRVDLTPLDKTGSRLLANELLKKLPEAPAALRDLLTGNAEGNPFYMEELVKMLIDQGAIRTHSEGGAWSVDVERLLVTQVPPTLTGVLQARLDGLPTSERRALQQASIVGAVFWDRALAAIETQAAEQLPSLVQRELTLPRADAPLEGLREYAFRHQVLHQVTYDTVLRRHKREGHARVAQWLANLTEEGGLRAGDLLSLAAAHFEHAEDASNAAEFHARAAEHAGQRMAHEPVLEHVGRALALLGEPDGATLRAQAALRWRLLDVREATFGLQARRDEEAADQDALERLAEALDDDRRRAEVARRRALRLARIADWAGQERAARQGMTYATRAGDDRLRLHALRLLAWAQTMQSGDFAGARVLVLQALEEARRLGLRDVEARMLNSLATIASVHHDYVTVLNLERQALLIYREIGARVTEAIAQLNLGECWLHLGDLPQARRDLEAALHLLRANGDRVWEGTALGHLSALALRQGDDARALALARQALDIAQAAQARDGAVFAGLRLGAAESALGRPIEARQAYARALALAREIDSPGRHAAAAGLARVALTEGDADAARVALRPLLDHVAAGGTLVGTQEMRLVELTCHQVLARAGDPRADEWLVRAHTTLMALAEVIERSGGDGERAISGAALRQGFLQHIPWHREIVAAWARRAAAGEGASAASD